MKLQAKALAAMTPEEINILSGEAGDWLNILVVRVGRNKLEGM